MTHKHRIVFALVAALSLTACGPGRDDGQPSRDPPPVKDTAFGDLVGTVDKAKGVQDTVDAHKRATDAQVRANEGDEAQ